MTTPTVASYEYKNDYLYIIIRQAPELGPAAALLCCGVNMTTFAPLCRGSHGICSNPAFKGLQLLRTDLAAFAIANGVRLGRTGYGDCMLISPKGEGWYRESLLLDNSTPRIAKTIVQFAVRDLLKKVLTVAAPEAVIPKKLPDPQQLQRFIRSLEKK
jgi:hypothetical protein